MFIFADPFNCFFQKDLYYGPRKNWQMKEIIDNLKTNKQFLYFKYLYI